MGRERRSRQREQHRSRHRREEDQPGSGGSPPTQTVRRRARAGAGSTRYRADGEREAGSLPVSEGLGPALVLHPGKERSLQRRHPWIYSNAVGQVVGDPASGDTVRVLSWNGTFLAWAAFSPMSSIRARVWTFDESEAIDNVWIGRRVREAVLRRAALVGRSNALRLVFGEADGLPGVVVDRYDDTIVFQLLSAGAEAWRAAIVSALAQIPGVRRLYERSDAAVRQREGLDARAGPVPWPQAHDGVNHPGTDEGIRPVPPIEIVEDGIAYRVDIAQGHKTGFYIDQRDNRLLVRQLASGRSVLNCFSYTGGFSWSAAAGGADRVVSVDSSGDAMAMARQHPCSTMPGLGDRMEWLEANVFDALRQFHDEGRRFDVIVLDPPKFAPSAQHIDRAARAYKEINLKALRLLNPAGHMLTFSCSGAISVDLFQKIVAGAVIDSRVDCQLVRRLGAGEDHPMAMTHPEGEYLKGLLLRRA